MASMAQAGQLIGGRYRLVDQLGSAGFGSAWRATDETLGMPVAVKQVWLPPAASETEHAARLAGAEREARAMARLRDHPNVLAAHDVVVEDGALWVVTRLVNGQPLAARIASGGPLSTDQVASVAAGSLAALGAAHAVGIVHRDVRPSSVLLGANGEVLLGDFGLTAHHVDTTTGTATGTGQVLGLVEYRAPEQLRGMEGLAASDLFSLGATLFEAVEGFSPFRRDTAAAARDAVLVDPVPPPHHAGRLAPLITRLLEKDPAARPSIPQAMALLGAPAPNPGRTRLAVTLAVITLVLVLAGVLTTVLLTTGSDTTSAALPSAPTTSRATSPTESAGGDFVPSPCDAMTDSISEKWSLGEGNPAHRSGSSQWTTMCKWSSGNLPDGGYFMLMYSSANVSFEGSSIPISGGGLPDNATAVTNSSGNGCIIHWRSSFGRIAVVAYQPGGSTQETCQNDARFVVDLGSSLPN